MKALSVNSYYATLILEGRKTVECRSWKTDYRGEILICANSTKNDFCLCGRAACIVELVDIMPFTPDHLQAACMEQMPDDAKSRKYYAWIINVTEDVMPVKIKGQLNLFNVDDALVDRIASIAPANAKEQKLMDTANITEDSYIKDFHENILIPAYHNYNKIIKDNTTIPHINNAKANAFLDLTGFTPADIWDVMPDGFTRS